MTTHPEGLTRLIEELEKATGPSRELDLECWWWLKANRGGQPMSEDYRKHNLLMNDAPRYTQSWDAVRPLVNGLYCIFAMEEPGAKYLPANQDGSFIGAKEYEASHPNPFVALLICIAKARAEVK